LPKSKGEAREKEGEKKLQSQIQLIATGVPSVLQKAKRCLRLPIFSVLHKLLLIFVYVTVRTQKKKKKRDLIASQSPHPSSSSSKATDGVLAPTKVFLWKINIFPSIKQQQQKCT